MPDKEYGIDDITWNDLDLDLFLKSFDRTCSRNGGEYLYDMLRRPLITEDGQAELKERGRVSDLFRNDPALRDRYIRAFEEQEELDLSSIPEKGEEGCGNGQRPGPYLGTDTGSRIPLSYLYLPSGRLRHVSYRCRIQCFHLL